MGCEKCCTRIIQVNGSGGLSTGEQASLLALINNQPTAAPANATDLTVFPDPLNPPAIAIFHEADPISKTHLFRDGVWRTTSTTLPENS